jgi:superfamily II DNA or RNA helicase
MELYTDFLANKAIRSAAVGIANPPQLNPALFGYQSDLVRWALKRGRAAIFADCGMGKTLMQLEWANAVAGHTGGKVLILTPLAVAQQTAAEAQRFGIDAEVCRDGVLPACQVVIANYQSLHKFSATDFAGVVLDESSILKSFDGKFRSTIIDMFADTPYRLACTATPAPNDHVELGNHSEFLGVMRRTEMLATFFCHDGGETQVWRLKGHAQDAFWQWVCSWGVMIRRPSDLGYSDAGFDLPAMKVIEHSVESGIKKEGSLFADDATDLESQRAARRATLTARCQKVAEMVNGDNSPWLVWCELNDEGDELARLIPGAVQVAGADSDDDKTARMVGFANGLHRVLITKPKIAGFGMNWQHCAKMAFVGLTHSYEQFYQATRRCWRFGQTQDVQAHVVVTDVEAAVARNIKRKEREASKMVDSMIQHTSKINTDEVHASSHRSDTYTTHDERGRLFTALLGDCVERVSELPDNSVHFSVFSPPFASLYTYSNSSRDMGNCRSDGEFFAHFGFLIKELLRVVKPGRLLAFHCMNLPTSKERDGYIGIRDFRGALIKAFEDGGWIYHSEVCIWKDPVTAMQRTKALGLLHKTIRKDSAMSRQGIPDYLVVMRKPGDNTERVAHTHDEFPVDLWQRYASPVWAVAGDKDDEGFHKMTQDINPSDTLQKESAREDDDERHICPLQLDVIRRAIRLWTNPGDTVLSPFMGIGSEGYVSLQEGRRFVGVELKRSYYKQAVANLVSAETRPTQESLFGDL